MTAPLHHLFSLSLTESVVPNDWKRHNIIPVFKSGDKSTVKNYHPISAMYQKCWNGYYIIEFLISIQILSHAINMDSAKTNLLYSNYYCILMICVQTEGKLTVFTLILVKHSTVFHILYCN